MTDITLPDFEEWTDYILSVRQRNLQVEIKASLQAAFDQGRSLGQREGRELAEKEWWKDQDMNEFPEFENGMIYLSLTDSQRLLDALDKPPQPNEALKELMKSKSPWDEDNGDKENR